jgi:hypothetical protein
MKLFGPKAMSSPDSVPADCSCFCWIDSSQVVFSVSRTTGYCGCECNCSSGSFDSSYNSITQAMHH